MKAKIIRFGQLWEDLQIKMIFIIELMIHAPCGE